MFIFSVFILLVAIRIFGLFRKNEVKEMPPGPNGLPILGHLPWLVINPGRKLLQWSQLFGTVFTIKFGSFRTIVLNDVDSIKEAFRVKTLNGRPPVKFIKDTNRNKGITMADDANEQRQFIVKSMRKFSLQPETVEFYCHREITNIMNLLENKNGQLLKINKIFEIPTINAIWTRVMSGYRLEPGQNILNLLDKLGKISGAPSVLNRLGFVFPSVAKWLPNLSGHNHMLETFDQLHNEVQRILNVHKQTRCSGSPRDIVDAYFDKVDQMQDVSSTFYMKHAQGTITFSDIFLGATETTTGTMEWVMLYLAKHPHVQHKLHLEIKEIIGNSLPSLSHRPSLPYTEAVLHEVLRLCPTLPLGVGHYSMADTQFRDFLIPKGTMLIGNIYGVHHNRKFWGDDVDSFRPERFISEDGTFRKSPYFIVFGAGKRSCPGETWAKDLLFLYITSIFQKFYIQFVDHKKSFLNYFEGTFGVTMRTKPFYVKLTSYDSLHN